MGVVTGVVLFIRAMFASRATIAAENLALRHQLGVLAPPEYSVLVAGKGFMRFVACSRIGYNEPSQLPN
jgi:hypothetical protein